MADETKKMLGLILVIAVVSYGLSLLQTGDIHIPNSGGGGTSTPNLYELTRQTAENTRHIFWLIVVCFTAWSFRSYKTGK